jgi:ABC-type branched-subunit amino acid transport system ATPase component
MVREKTPTVLEVEDVYLSFGGVNALLGVGFEGKEGEIFSIIGPNGAGKSSLFNSISGLYCRPLTVGGMAGGSGFGDVRRQNFPCL